MLSDSPRAATPDGIKATGSAARVRAIGCFRGAFIAVSFAAMTASMATPHGQAEATPAAAPAARGRCAELLILAVGFLLVNLAGALFQKQITFNDGKGWEGIDYYEVAAQYTQGKWHVAAEAPMLYRIGTPFLASLLHRRVFPDDLFLCFRIVNAVANALTLVLLVLWLRRFLGDWRIRTALGLVFLLQWDAPTRWLYFYPAHTDPWMWVFLLASLLAVEGYREQPSSSRMLRVAVLGAVGVAFREVVLVVPVAFLFVRNPLRGVTPRDGFSALRAIVRGGWRQAVPLTAAVAALLAIRVVARQTNDYSFAATLLHWLYDKPLLVYLQSVFLAFGPAVWFPILGWRQALAFLAGRQHLAAYLFAFAFLGLSGGTDTERLLYWSMPVVYVLIGRALEQQWPGLRSRRGLLALVAVAQLVASRAVFWPIPDHPNDYPNAWPVFTPFARHVPYVELFSFFEPRPMQLASLLESLAFGGLLAWWLGRGRLASAPPTPTTPTA